jgi:uncharacterized protein (TIGR02996 family)
MDDRLRLAFWPNPEKLDALRVWADFLNEQGDPRGEFIQLSVLEAPTPEQRARCLSLKKRLGGKLVGPARPFLRTWVFGGQGLVTSVVCEAPLFIEGFDHICHLNPRLTAAVTAVRKQDTLEKMGTLALHRIQSLILEWNALTDAGLIQIGPALEGVKNLSLAFNQITGAGLRAIAPYVADLEYLALGTSLKQREDGAAIGNGWVDALCDMPAFHNLRAVHLFNYTANPTPERAKRLLKLPRMKSVTFGEPAYLLADVEARKRGE